MSPTERLKVLLFLALFCGAVGFLSMLLSCGTEYWLLAEETCTGDKDQRQAARLFHEGLFWRCSFSAFPHEFSIWNYWISNQPAEKVCQTAFLFPFPIYEPALPSASHHFPAESFEHPSAIVFRTFWSTFLISGVGSIVVGGFASICAGPLTNHKLYRVGAALQLCGGFCLLAVQVMYLIWVQVLDTLEEFALHRRVSGCPGYHLTIQHGPSFYLAPVAAFFCLLAGLLFILVGRGTCTAQTGKKNTTTEHSVPGAYVIVL